MKAHEYAFCPECGQKLEGDEFLCPSCGFKLAAQPPVAPPPVTPPPIQQQTPPVTPPPTPKAPPVPEPPKAPNPPTPPPAPPKPQQPISYQPIQNDPYIPPKKKKKTGLIIVLIILGVIVIGGGVGAFLIYNGTIPKDKVDFLPEKVLEMLTPQKKESEKTTTAPVPQVSKKFYVVEATALVKGKTVLMLSSIMETSKANATKDGAETAFIEFAKINYPDDYTLFLKSMHTSEFTDYEKAKAEQDHIEQMYRTKKYEIRILNVQY